MDIKKPAPVPKPRGRPRKTAPPAPTPASDAEWSITPEIVQRILEAEQEE